MRRPDDQDPPAGSDPAVTVAVGCWDNAVAESFFATLKDELIYRRACPTRQAARAAIFEFIEIFYNRHRLSHGVPGGLSH